jgi:hypothetical protein
MSRSLRVRTFRLAVAFVALGVAARLFRYLLSFPIWGDEAFICLNFAERDFLSLTRELDYMQVAPLLFLWGQKAIYLLLGSSNYAMRLLPLLAGLLALGLFWHLARRTLPPLGAMLAVSIFALSRWPVAMCAFVKPYSLDALAAVGLLVLGVEWLRRPEQDRWLVALCLAFPLVMISSYPAVFVAGGACVALLPVLWRQGRARAWGWFAAAGLLLTITFVAHLQLVGRRTHDSDGPGVQEGMVAYWKNGFPPAEWGRLPGWLASRHVGTLFAYPLGAEYGGSLLTVALCLAGACACWRGGQRPLLVMCLLPFGLNLAAAALHRYPYGEHPRLMQHLAPAICLLAGAGGGWLIERLASRPRLQLRCLQGCACALGVVGVVPMGLDAKKPYRDLECRWSDTVGRELRRCVGEHDQVVVLHPRRLFSATLEWQLLRLGDRVRWGGAVDWEELDRTGGRLWCVGAQTIVAPVSDRAAAETARPQDALARALAGCRGAWVPLEGFIYVGRGWGEPPVYLRCEVFPCLRVGLARQDAIRDLPALP